MTNTTTTQYEKRQRTNMIARLRRLLNRRVWTSGKEQRKEILTAMLGFAPDWYGTKQRGVGCVAYGGFDNRVLGEHGYQSYRYWLTEDGNIVDRQNGFKVVFTKTQ